MQRKIILAGVFIFVYFNFLRIFQVALQADGLRLKAVANIPTAHIVSAVCSDQSGRLWALDRSERVIYAFFQKRLSINFIAGTLAVDGNGFLWLDGVTRKLIALDSQGGIQAVAAFGDYQVLDLYSANNLLYVLGRSKLRLITPVYRPKDGELIGVKKIGEINLVTDPQFSMGVLLNGCLSVCVDEKNRTAYVFAADGSLYIVAPELSAKGQAALKLKRKLLLKNIWADDATYWAKQGLVVTLSSLRRQLCFLSKDGEVVFTHRYPESLTPTAICASDDFLVVAFSGASSNLLVFYKLSQ